MNFKFCKILLILLSLLQLISCGVKGDPVPPQGTAIPALIQRYIPTPTPIPSEENSRT